LADRFDQAGVDRQSCGKDETASRNDRNHRSRQRPPFFVRVGAAPQRIRHRIVERAGAKDRRDAAVRRAARFEPGLAARSRSAFGPAAPAQTLRRRRGQPPAPPAPADQSGRRGRRHAAQIGHGTACASFSEKLTIVNRARLRQDLRGFTGTGVYGVYGVYVARYELPNLAPRSRRRTFSTVPPRPSTALSAESARRRRRGGRIPRWRLRRRACPQAASGKSSRPFLSDNRNSR